MKVTITDIVLQANLNTKKLMQLSMKVCSLVFLGFSPINDQSQLFLQNLSRSVPHVQSDNIICCYSISSTRSGIDGLYDVSYMWNGFMSFTFMMIFSIVFSLIIGTVYTYIYKSIIRLLSSTCHDSMMRYI